MSIHISNTGNSVPNSSTLQLESKFNSVWPRNFRFFLEENLPVHPFFLETDAKTCIFYYCLNSHAAKPYVLWSRARFTTTPRNTQHSHVITNIFTWASFVNLSTFMDSFIIMTTTNILMHSVTDSRTHVTRWYFAKELDLHDLSSLKLSRFPLHHRSVRWRRLRPETLLTHKDIERMTEFIICETSTETRCVESPMSKYILHSSLIAASRKTTQPNRMNRFLRRQYLSNKLSKIREYLKIVFPESLKSLTPNLKVS